MVLYTNYFIETLRKCDPSKILLIEDYKCVSAGDLLQAATNLALSLNIQPGQRIVIAVKPGIEFLQVMYAGMMLRAITTIIDPEMGRENYLIKLKQFAPQHAFVDSRLALLNEHPILKMVMLKLNKSIPSFPRIKNCSLYLTGLRIPIFQKHKRVSSMIKAVQKRPDFQMTSENEDFLVTYTSGTLHEPKGVVHSYFGLSNSIRQLTLMLQSNKDEVIATHLPHFALLGISAGIKVYLWDAALNAERKLSFITNYGITTLFGPPSDFVPLISYLNAKGLSLPKCLKSIYLGSAPIYTSFLAKLVPLSDTIKITCMYGMTESLLVCMQDARQKLKESVAGDLVGSPFSNVKITIAPDGEVCLESDQMFSRYWKGKEVDRLHHTGDIGQLTDDGKLILLGRKKDMIIRGNFNIYPGLYEPTISKISGVNEVAMIGIYCVDKSDEEVILVVDSEYDMMETEIMNQLKYGAFSIDKAALPDRIIFMKIPHSGRQQKIDKKELARMLKK